MPSNRRRRGGAALLPASLAATGVRDAAGLAPVANEHRRFRSHRYGLSHVIVRDRLRLGSDSTLHRFANFAHGDAVASFPAALLFDCRGLRAQLRVFRWRRPLLAWRRLWWCRRHRCCGRGTSTEGAAACDLQPQDALQRQPRLAVKVFQSFAKCLCMQAANALVETILLRWIPEARGCGFGCRRADGAKCAPNVQGTKRPCHSQMLLAGARPLVHCRRLLCLDFGGRLALWQSL